jgi:hypothetical protein
MRNPGYRYWISYHSRFMRLVPGGINLGVIGSTCTAIPILGRKVAVVRGLTLVHFSAQPEPLLTLFTH